MAFMKMYQGNPTAGGTDGIEISSDTERAPITMVLDASKAESGVAKCAVRCESGYSIEGDVSISFSGDTAARWQVASDNNYSSDSVLTMADWQSSISLANVTATNKIFWVKALSLTSEKPQNDRSVDVVAEGLVVATEG